MPIEILMPALSPTMEEGTLAKWLINEGDIVNSGDVLAEIETDKATMEIEAVEEGKIAKILVPDGTAGVQVNQPIALLLEDGEEETDLAGYVPRVATKTDIPVSPPEPTPNVGTQPNEGVTVNTEVEKETRIKASPLARRLAKEAGLDLRDIRGTGPNGRIIKADIEAAKLSPSSEQKSMSASVMAPEATTTEVGMPRGGAAEYLERLGIPAGTYALEPLDGMRRVIAKRLTESARDIPHFPLNIDCKIDELLALRKQLNEQAVDGVKISVNDLLIKACAIALKQVPKANASYTPDGIAYHHHADVSVAVSIDGGLITPIIREAENKGLSTISVEMKDLAARARERKLKPQEYQGGTFSISNLGMFGIKSFQSIINPPQGMILSVGAGEARPVIVEGEISIATLMSVTLACDHRVVDGVIGANWLSAFKSLVENPITMML